MDQITVEVAYATPEQQIIIPLQITIGTIIANAIIMSKISSYFPELDIAYEDLLSLPIGIFGKKIDINTYYLQDQDRIEIYRPLNKTPNQKRLERAKNNAK